MVRRRRAEVKVSTLSAEQKRELVEAKTKGTQHFCQIFCGVEAGWRQGISPSASDERALVVTFKDDGSSTASRRSRQIFLTLAN